MGEWTYSLYVKLKLQQLQRIKNWIKMEGKPCTEENHPVKTAIAQQAWKFEGKSDSGLKEWENARWLLKQGAQVSTESLLQAKQCIFPCKLTESTIHTVSSHDILKILTAFF